MELNQAIEFVAARRNGVLTTQKRDGRPQLSNIVYAVFPDGTIRISVTADRAKSKNLARDPRASLHVTADDFGSYVVLDADATLTPPATDPDDATGTALVDLYRQIAGEHPDWAEYRRAMVADRRLVVTLHPVAAYGMIR